MQDQQILLTGGVGGLGIGVTKVLLAEGAMLTLPYIDDAAMIRLRNTLTPTELTRVRFVAADLSDESVVEQLVKSMERVDALVHLVGGFSMGKTHEYDFAQWKQDFDLNLNTTFLVCKHCLGRMLKTGYGRMVTVGSRGAIEPVGQLASYSASKAGVVALTKAIANETKGTNITANVVLPSVIDTQTNRQAMGEEQAEAWVKPESIGKVISFLASEAAQDIRGATVPVYGDV